MYTADPSHVFVYIINRQYDTPNTIKGASIYFQHVRRRRVRVGRRRRWRGALVGEGAKG
jgi:hypothetical protein